MSRVLLWSLGIGAVLLAGYWLADWQGDEAALSEEERAIFSGEYAQTFGEEPGERIRYHLRAVAAGEGGEPEAVIARDGTARRYREGQFLDGSNTRVSWILDDAVLLERAGYFSLLWRESARDSGEHYEVEPAPVARGGRRAPHEPPMVVDRRDDELTTRIASEYRARLYSNPLSLIDAIEVDVKKCPDGGRLYRLAPGSDREAFERLGLQRGDEVIAINGIGMNDREALTDIYQELADAPHLTTTLRRDGRTVVLLIALES